jgi:hypothetical protein
MQIPGAREQGGHGAETDQEDTMATLGRSLKSSSYLSRARRPGMSPRALSNSSDVSVASAGSNRSEDQLDFVMSAANTPFGELSQAEAMASSSVPPDAPQQQLQQRQLSRGKSLVSLFLLVVSPPRAADSCAPVRHRTGQQRLPGALMPHWEPEPPSPVRAVQCLRPSSPRPRPSHRTSIICPTPAGRGSLGYTLAPAQRHRYTTVGSLSPPVQFPCVRRGGSCLYLPCPALPLPYEPSTAQFPPARPPSQTGTIPSGHGSLEIQVAPLVFYAPWSLQCRETRPRSTAKQVLPGRFCCRFARCPLSSSCLQGRRVVIFPSPPICTRSLFLPSVPPTPPRPAPQLPEAVHAEKHDVGAGRGRGRESLRHLRHPHSSTRPRRSDSTRSTLSQDSVPDVSKFYPDAVH